jgi:hypothetical protein
MGIQVCSWTAALLLLQGVSCGYAQSAPDQRPAASSLMPFKVAQAGKVCHLDSRCTSQCWARFQRREITRAEASRCQSKCCRNE